MSNPFAPTFGVSPAILKGREHLVSAFGKSLDSGIGDPRRALLISGPKGFGKTVTLNIIEDEAAAHGWVVLRAQPHNLVQPLVDTVIPQTIAALKREGSKRQIGFVNKVSTPESKQNEQNGEISSSPSLISSLNELCDVIGPQSGVLVSVDEVQSIDPAELWELATTIQDLRRDNRQIAFAAAGLPAGINDLLRHPGATFLQRAQQLSLTPLSPEETREILSTTAKKGGLTLEGTVLDDAVKLTRGYPFLIQLLGYHLYEQAAGRDGVVSADDLVAVTPDVLDTLGQLIHKPALAGIPNSQMEYLRAMAELQEGEKPVSTGAIAERLNKEPRDLSMPRHGLIERELVYCPQRGYLNFIIPHMSHHLLYGGTRNMGWD